jgi:hypothetical protein
MTNDVEIGAPDQNELIIALVAAVGTDIGMVADELAIELREYAYDSELLRLSTYLAEEFDKDFFKVEKFDQALWEAMTAGDTLRNAWDRGDALALHAISDIVVTRNQRTGSVDEAGDTWSAEQLGPGLDRFAFILRSLKTQEELATLRAVYGPRLVVIAAYSPEDERIAHLAVEIAASRKTQDRTTWAYTPEALVGRDEKEEQSRGQDVRAPFIARTSSSADGVTLSCARMSGAPSRFCSARHSGPRRGTSKASSSLLVQRCVRRSSAVRSAWRSPRPAAR